MAKENIQHSIISNLVLTMISLIRWLFSVYTKISNYKWDMTGILRQWEIKEISYFHMSKVNKITIESGPFCAPIVPSWALVLRDLCSFNDT